MCRSDRTTDARGQAFGSINMSEADVESEGDRSVFVGQHDEIAHAHRGIVKLAAQGAVETWGKVIHRVQ